LKIALVVSDFNCEVTGLMLERARGHAALLGVEVSHVVHVPGVFDMGVVIKRLLARKDVDGVVMLGAVIKGDTEHDEVIMTAAARAAAELAVQFDKPVALGVSGPGMDRMQALDRIDNAKNAVESVVRLIKTLKQLSE
jgi:6,7-dimethyl-8-ribityllumazine synthase